MTTVVGRGVRIEIGKTEGTPIPVTAISKAKPGVATANAHGLQPKSVGYLKDVTGMVQLEGQAVRLGTTDTNTFGLEDIDTTAYPDFGGTANFVPITAWSTYAKATSYEIGGGAANALDDTALLDNITQNINGLLAAQTLSIGENSEEVPSEAKAIINAAARAGNYLVVRITLKGGATRVCRCQPSLPGESVQKGAIGTGTVAWTVKGFVTYGAP